MGGCLLGILLIIGILILVALVFGFEGLIVWGIVTLVCWAFKLPYEITYPQALAIVIILDLVGGIIKSIFG